MTNAERRVVDSFWDLRDDAYDHPGRWEGLTAEALFQRLAECVEEAEERGSLIDWPGVAARMVAWRAGERKAADDMGGDVYAVILNSERKFAVWKYMVGHSMLLLRSVKSELASSRVDVLFVGVERMDIPSTMDGLRITGEGSYELSGPTWRGSVTALNCAVREDSGEYFDPSPFREGSGI